MRKAQVEFAKISGVENGRGGSTISTPFYRIDIIDISSITARGLSRRIIKMRDEGLSTRGIARILDTSKTNVQNTLTDAGVANDPIHLH